jgi:hypothetical protein
MPDVSKRRLIAWASSYLTPSAFARDGRKRPAGYGISPSMRFAQRGRRA